MSELYVFSLTMSSAINSDVYCDYLISEPSIRFPCLSRTALSPTSFDNSSEDIEQKTLPLMGRIFISSVKRHPLNVNNNFLVLGWEIRLMLVLKLKRTQTSLSRTEGLVPQLAAMEELRMIRRL